MITNNLQNTKEVYGTNAEYDELSGSVLECLTLGRGVAGSPEALCCVLEQDILSSA